MRWFIFVICYCVCNSNAQLLNITIREIPYQIAGIFESNALTQRLAFNESLRNARLGDFGLQSTQELVNEAKDLRLEPIILQTKRSDSYTFWKDLCSNKEMRPIVVFGPQTPISDGAIRDQCAMAHIPHIQATWQPLDPDLSLNNENAIADNNDDDDDNDEDKDPEFQNISINFFPPADDISHAYAMLLKYYKWENFAVLYEDNFGLLRIQKVLAEYSSEFPITIRKLEPESDNYKVFKDLREFKEFRIILDCNVDRVLTYLNQSNAVNMANHYQHYILMSMDASTVAEELLKYECNITWLSVADYDKLQDAKHFLAPRVGKWTSEQTVLESPPVSNIKMEALIIDDIANHVLKALQKVKTNDAEWPDHICQTDQSPWINGALLQREILMTNSTGVSGNIQFDNEGRRINYNLYVNEINVGKHDTIGIWNSTSYGEIVETRPDSDILSKKPTSKHFIVISKKAKPYFYEKVKCKEEDTDCVEEDADEEYEGFVVDLVKSIFDNLRENKFNYTYSFLHDFDKGYGKYDAETKKWDGLIGDLLDKKADLAVCDLTITEERKKVVDFSQPFMSLGISILYIKEKKIQPGMFSFLYPYTFDVWMHTATAYCVVSIILFVCSRISPADWENPQPCDKDPEELENIWNFKNCAWLTMGSIMTQGCDILPKAVGSRWVCSMWWFFAVIVCQTYIAQLAASMTSALENEPINSVEDLAKQNKILYGAIGGGSTFEFFKSSQDKTYRRIFETITNNPALLVKSNDEGERRVLKRKGKYAFFMESCSIEYKVKRECDLKKVGGELDSKDYGIAMPANSPFRSHINTAILELKEKNVLDKIKKKWWEDKNGAHQCQAPTDVNDVEGDLEIQNLIGAFIVLIVGLIFSVLITAAEFMNEVRNIVVREKVSHKEVFVKELKASLNFFQLQKPVIRNPSRAPSISSSSSIQSKKSKRAAAVVENFLDFEKEVQ